ncbi:hypothetical protein PTTG_07250 [Puccinia triticina 1-1 BBBD Race 1]|uniref:Uncharacterized protein n=2 Tax=Puccinia triticina TaxID=208348 RepID=A0A180G5H0_PUCT1|nr:uncharacterized protein PtA15_17A63 [Puccinia triticina]OAV87886.1 hypothetical protein PTTG_07250 [Puccinia triticina 1-1 BBBD Race 1]WAQ92582.1 hypothetical protein PtA15_17A63 [Puccinia triticina]WAR63468.1 hypothetical protein PtB15_17B68 [Puccinia triticina]
MTLAILKRLILRHGLSAALPRNNAFLRPHPAPSAVLACIHTPPPTILSGFFRPLRLSPNGLPLHARQSAAFSPAWVFGRSAQPPFEPLLRPPFRASYSPGPATARGPNIADQANQLITAFRAAQPASSPLVDEIVHDLVAARFALPVPSADY